MRFWIVALCMLPVPASLPAEAVTEEAKAIESDVAKLSDRVYRITLDYGLRPNFAASIGADGILLVDTGHEEAATELLGVVSNLGQAEIRYIINTHAHGDHAGGNRVIGKDAVIIGYNDLEQMVSQGVLSRGDRTSSPPSGELFDTFYSLRFNYETIRLIPRPGIHSRSDLIVHFMDSAVVHMGDLLLTKSFPAVGPMVKEYMVFLDEVIEAFPEETQFIGGHGPDYTMEDIKRYKKMLLDTIALIRKDMEAGRSLEELQEKRILKDFESWGVFLDFLDTDYWIQAVFNSYK